MDLKGRAALVTGAQQGIGRACAVALAAAGADVAINWLDDEAAANAVAADVVRTGGRALLVQGSVAGSGAGTRMVDAVTREWGRLDILVNNAGIFPRMPFLDLTEAVWTASTP